MENASSGESDYDIVYYNKYWDNNKQMNKY